MKQFKVISPLYIDLERKTKKDKRVRLNLNIYRNLHQMVEGQVKKKYQDEIIKQFPDVKYDKIEIEFTMYKKLYNKDGSIKKTIIDKSNVYSIIIKYLLDALVKAEVIEDDNDLIVKKETINVTQYIENDDDDERAEIIIKSID